MAYGSKGRKPIERASKITHAEIINNPSVAAYLRGCTVPPAAVTGSLLEHVHPVEAADTSPVRAVVAIDGGYTETYVRADYPSASIAFFTFGPLLFKLEDLRRLDRQRFIAPEDMAALKQLQRHSLTLPTRGIRMAGEKTLSSSIRRTVYDFFCEQGSAHEEPLIRSLSWLLFRRWEPTPDDKREEVLERCPTGTCEESKLRFKYDSPSASRCPRCGEAVYLTDVFRLHERIDEEQGAGGILAYVMTLLEQMVLAHVVRTVWGMKRTLLSEILFLKDGPLAFFGVVAPLYKPMRELTHFLLLHHNLYLAGLEKSGSFVDHATLIEPLLAPGSLFIPDNAYIYRHIIPGEGTDQVYGANTYYGQKLFFKSDAGEMYVATIPTLSHTGAPTPADFPNLHVIVRLVSELRCHMYDNALIPVALANKLVSLSDFPSQRILTVFARQEIA